MMKAIGFFSAALLAGQAALAANIFVPHATGEKLSNDQRQHVTDMVKRAVENAPEHSLVQSEQDAEFVLQPSVVQRGEEMVLRIEKQQDGQVTAISEETIPSLDAGTQQAQSAAQATLDEGQSRQPAAVSESEGTTESFSEPSMAQSSDSPASEAGGDVRAPSPLISQREGPSFFQIGAGTAFALGLESDKLMYNIHGSYNYNFTDQIVGKIMADMNLGTGSDTTRFMYLGAGADWFPTAELTTVGQPYLTADLGFGNARNADDFTADAPVIGAGAGFMFTAAEMNWDVNILYSIMTTELEGRTPSVLGLRASVGF